MQVPSHTFESTFWNGIRGVYVDIYQVHWPDPLVPIEETRRRVGHPLDLLDQPFVTVAAHAIPDSLHLDKLRYFDTRSWSGLFKLNGNPLIPD
jgi:hypothetical protein